MESTDKLQLFVQTVQSLEPSVTYFVLFNLKRVAIFPLLLWFCYILCYMYKILMLILFSENLFWQFFFYRMYNTIEKKLTKKRFLKINIGWSVTKHGLNIYFYIFYVSYFNVFHVLLTNRWIQQLWLILSALNISFKLLWGWHTKWNSEDRLLVVNEMNSLHLKTFFFGKELNFY